MPVTFDELRTGQSYDRPELAERWGYVSHHAISRGVVTPAGTPYVILFVTKEKQQFLTQYEDHIEGDRLYWEGEEKHGSDDRVIRAEESGDDIRLFYREKHHSPFIYYGALKLMDHERRTDAPSRFEFLIQSLAGANAEDPLGDVGRHEGEYARLPETEREAIVQSRLGQGRFRRDVLALWGGCAVTGMEDARVLKASHIKPWCESDNDERLDPHNGLALVPNLDTLFDGGLVTFDPSGRIRISGTLSPEVLRGLGVDPEMMLRDLPKRMERYLRFHREYVFVDAWSGSSVEEKSHG